MISTFLYNMRIPFAELEVVQLAGNATLSAILPTRGAEWNAHGAGAVPRVNKAIVSRPLGALAQPETMSYRSAGHEPPTQPSPAAGMPRPSSSSVGSPTLQALQRSNSSGISPL